METLKEKREEQKSKVGILRKSNIKETEKW